MDMDRRRLLAAIVVSAGSMAVAGCSEWFPVSYRYRVTVEVETPWGLRTGSNVMEASVAKHSLRIGDSGGHRQTLRGEAVILDFPNGAVMFALIDNDVPFIIRNTLLRGVGRKYSTLESYAQLGSSALRGRSEVVPASWTV
jgi:hypothetical protein